MRSDTGAAVRLEDYRPPDFLVDRVDLDFDLQPSATVVRSRLSLRRRGRSPSDGPAAPLRLDGRRLTLTRLAIDGRVLGPGAYDLDEEGLTLHAAPDAFSLEIDTRIDPAGNTALEGLYMSAGRFCTQCEPEGFRTITFFPDRPDVMARYRVRLEADAASCPILLSNGNAVETGLTSDGRAYAVWEDPHPKPSYLFALVAGDYDVLKDAFVTASGRRVALAIHVDKGQAARAIYAMDALKRAMAWDEQTFGREYDLDVFNIVAVRDFNFGAMENKGLNIFNAAYVLADPSTATDTDYAAIESIVAHEYFHNWTGNRITCRDWFQLCLKEGLTVFRDQEFSADMRSRAVQRIKDVRLLRQRQFAEDAGPLSHPVRPSSYVKIDNFYTATVYEKGAELVRALKTMLGPDGFKAGMDLYFDRCDGMAATVEDFLAAFSDACGQDLSDFARWYGQAGTPHLTVRLASDAEGVFIDLAQSSRGHPADHPGLPLPIPVRFGVLTRTGAPAVFALNGGPPAREHMAVLRGERETWRLSGAPADGVLSLLRGLSAPVLVEAGHDDAMREVLMAHDPDPFVRWDMSQLLARRALLSLGDAARNGAPQPCIDGFVAAYGRCLEAALADPAFAALVARLPETSDVILDTSNAEPELLHAARQTLRAMLAGAHEELLRGLIEAPRDTGFTPDAASAGRRALRNAALDLYMARGALGAAAAERAFASADNMTDQLAALDALSHASADQFDAALDRFRAQWRDEPLVMDKWFAVQSAAARDDALARIGALRRDPAFDLRNPNRVRALASGLMLRNPRALHAADGSGYLFLAELVIDVDALNPAVAARLMTGFETWSRIEPGRHRHAIAAIERVLASNQLSDNTRDVARRQLGRA
jgi:aminopeptidase N